MLPILFNALTIIASLTTTAGVFVHDMQVDKFTNMALSMPTSVTEYESSNRLVNFGDDLHAHTAQVLVLQLGHSDSQIQPRNDEKKYLLQNRVVKGHHPFDNYNLPILG